MSKSILEVWDYRLSTAQPLIYKGAPIIPGVKDQDKATHSNWCVAVFSKGEKREALEFFDSGVKAQPHDTDDDMPDSIYDFLRTVRDKHSLLAIEELKPAVREIRRVDLIRQEATDAYNAILKEKM